MAGRGRPAAASSFCSPAVTCFDGHENFAYANSEGLKIPVDSHACKLTVFLGNLDSTEACHTWDCQVLVVDTKAYSTYQQPTYLKQCPAAGHAGGHTPLGLPGEQSWGRSARQPARHCHKCWASVDATLLASTECHMVG